MLHFRGWWMFGDWPRVAINSRETRSTTRNRQRPSALGDRARSPKPDWRAAKLWPLCVDLQAVTLVGHSCCCSRPRPALTALLAKTFAHTCWRYLQSSSHTARLPSILASRLPAHALLVICTSCLIVASSASYCKHALSFLSALWGIYRNRAYECIAGH